MHAATNAGGRYRWRPAGLAAAVAVAAALAIPALAAAHPAVYELTPTMPPTEGCNFGSDPSGACLVVGAKRYAVANDGFAMTFTETAGSENPDHSIINFQLMPGGFRKWRVGDEERKMSADDILGFAPARTSVQPHATCGQPVLNEAATIEAWQGSEPFFNYIPWQKVSAGLGDRPSKWIPVVQQKLAVDLASLPSDDPATKGVNEEAAAAQALCESKGGTYYKADASSNPAANAISEAVEPVQERVDSLIAAGASLEGELGAWKARAASLEGRVATLAGERASLAHGLGAAQRARAKLRRATSKLRRASAKKGKAIRKLRRQLRVARHG